MQIEDRLGTWVSCSLAFCPNLGVIAHGGRRVAALLPSSGKTVPFASESKG